MQYSKIKRQPLNHSLLPLALSLAMTSNSHRDKIKHYFSQLGKKLFRKKVCTKTAIKLTSYGSCSQKFFSERKMFHMITYVL